jgi:hypothetical protein
MRNKAAQPTHLPVDTYVSPQELAPYTQTLKVCAEVAPASLGLSLSRSRWSVWSLTILIESVKYLFLPKRLSDRSGFRLKFAAWLPRAQRFRLARMKPVRFTSCLLGLGLMPLLTVLFGACGTATPAEQSPAPSTTLVARSPSAEPAASAQPSAQAPASRPALAARATTPGKIQCETVDCDLATEVCCVSDPQQGGQGLVGTCMLKPTPNADGTMPWVCPTNSLVTERSCDEASDCSAGKRCCTAPYDESNLKHESCEAQCGGERCLAGSTCGNGNRCDAKDGARAGECPLAIKPPQCGKAACKAGERCCWDAEGKTGRCAEDCGEGASWFECTRPDHCAQSYSCNTWPGVSQYRCGGSGFQGGILCNTLKDCPKNLSALGFHPGAPVAKACAASEELPPGVKACVYE